MYLTEEEFKILQGLKFGLFDNGVEKIYLYRQKPILAKKYF